MTRIRLSCLLPLVALTAMSGCGLLLGDLSGAHVIDDGGGDVSCAVDACGERGDGVTTRSMGILRTLGTQTREATRSTRGLTPGSTLRPRRGPWTLLPMRAAP